MPYRLLLPFFIIALSHTSLFAQWHPTIGAYGAEASSVAATGAKVFVDTRGGFYRSFDEGRNWILVSNVHGNLLAVSSDILLRWDTTVERSTDDGITWSAATSIVSSLSFAGFAQRDAAIFAGSANGVYVSSDSGFSWKPTLDDLSSAGVTSIGCSDSILLIGTDFKGTYASSNSGAEWQQLAEGLPAGERYHRIESVAVVGSDLFAVSSHAILKYSRADSKWKNCDTAIHANVLSVAHGRLIVGGWDGNVFYSDDTGKTWLKGHGSSGIVTSIATADTMMYIGTWSSLFASSDGGATWFPSVNGINAVSFTTFAKTDNGLFALSGRNGVFSSSDDGASWKFAELWGASSIVDAGSNVIAAASTLYNSTDHGSTWNKDTALQQYMISALAIQENIIIACTREHLCFVSSNDGATWIERGSPQQTVNQILIDGLNVRGIGDAGLSYSNDTGATWYLSRTNSLITALALIDGNPIYYVQGAKLVSKGVPLANAVNALLYTGKALFAGTDHGVFISFDKGVSWAEVNAGLQDSSVTALGIINNYLVAAVGGTIWRRPLSEMIIANGIAESSTSAQTISVYPNPTTSSATISLTPEVSGYAEISIVNMLGQEVAMVYSGVLDGGEHNFSFDASRLAAPRGVYECIVRMNGRVRTLPIVIE
jgi:photosystem II stability/assembly factor-like uncharacterized protein